MIDEDDGWDEMDTTSRFSMVFGVMFWFGGWYFLKLISDLLWN